MMTRTFDTWNNKIFSEQFSITKKINHLLQIKFKQGSDLCSQYINFY